MAHRFDKHYTREQVRSLLPQVRIWLAQLTERREELQKQEKRLHSMMSPGRDIGGATINGWVRTLAAIQGLLLEFYSREIQIKDLERGLLDFPALLEGREVFLCWESAEEDVGFWHDLESGYAGRQPLAEEE